MKKVCFILTAEFAVRAFLLTHLKVLSKTYALTVIVNTDNPNFLKALGVDAQVIPLAINRKVHLISDLIIFLQLVRIFRKHKFDAVHSLMPKSGLLGMLSAKIVGVPIRLHTFTGQVWANKHGLLRWVFKSIDWLIGKLSTYNLVDGHSQLQFLLDEGVLLSTQSSVLLDGSIAGVDFARFKPNLGVRALVRGNLAIAETDFVFVYVGRLNKDKGVLDLAKAFNGIKHNNVYVMYVGPDEENMQEKIHAINHDKAAYIRVLPYTTYPEFYMAAADAICLPSYREGFGNVIIEAAAVGLPSVVSNIYGVIDSVEDEVTGLLHPPGDVLALTQCMRRLLLDTKLRTKLAENAQAKVHNQFDSRLVSAEWLAFYQAQFNNRNDG